MRNSTMLAALFACAGIVLAEPITYQGTLEDTGKPANGMYDMRFTIADAPVLGFALEWIDIDDVEVVDGLFEVELDFNDTLFTGDDRWLAIEVDGTFLNPRTKVNYVPFAIRANRASIADTLDVPAFLSATNATLNVHATSSTGTALLGTHSNSDGTAPGIHGKSNSTALGAMGLLGEIDPSSPGGLSAGVRGINNGRGSTGIGVYGSQGGSGWGVYGTTPSGRGVYGLSSEGTGMYARTVSGIGLFAQHSDSGTSTTLANEDYAIEALNNETDGVGTAVFASGGRTGIYGESVNSGFGPSLTRTGVSGFAGGFSTGADTFYGVQGFGQAPIEGGSRTAYGVYGGAQVGTSGNTAYGVFGEVFGPGGTKYAGFFAGNVHVQGTLSKLAGAFKIDHPLDPENKFLSHSFVESPEMMNIYSGVITLDAEGNAVVELPDYFGALNREFRYQLTAIGASMPNLYIASEISSNEFEIAGGAPNARVSWEVTGVRQDASAIAHPIVVEEDKPEHHRGKYLDPSAYGLGNEHAIHGTREEN